MKKLFLLLFLIISLAAGAVAQGAPPITFVEQDGSPRKTAPTKIVVSNGTMTCVGSVCTINTSGSGSGLADPGANGVVVRTAAGVTTARTLTGTSNEITVTDGTGVVGNPTFSLPAALTFTGKTITGGTFTAPTIGDFTNAAHGHTNAAGGGQLNATSVFSAGTVPVARLPIMVGDAGAGGTAGLVPAPATGDATRFLRGDGTWQTVSGASAYDTIQEEGSGLTQRTTLNFVGSSFTAADDTNRTTVTADSDLNALASNSTNGLWARTGSGTGTARTITGTSNEITVTNGDGVSGNPTLSLPSTIAGNRTFSGNLTFSKAVISTVVTLTDAANIATDASLSNRFKVTLGGNRTLDAPTNPTDGQQIVYEICQDGTGSRTLTLATGAAGAFAFGTDITGITLTTTASKCDFITAAYSSSADRWRVLGFVKGY